MDYIYLLDHIITNWLNYDNVWIVETREEIFIDYLFLFNVFNFVLAMKYLKRESYDKYVKWLKQHPVWSCLILLFVILLSYRYEV